ncbi:MULTISPECIES: DHA2 family efflux MFS transporter permease subunit [unclassified Sphingomonas]|uniref:DHA2 family efflux MFS transporter permease subunit n=1 Tax=unclassified Sphingomonas TaxID=196159 RepID=UPI00285FD675|nr:MULTISPECIES: DHA2 family efflux MFS transporter permease subunit [unclassified Sphingomonas]MDR6116526.1 DHA2 family multidrug resistance protein [Sphingomonas sp. SORGH_AS_0789]MDR6149799.1 DHA2 family multidrug resistance protein [Sphingomonas sp. SORGH_AS_0742]
MASVSIDRNGRYVGQSAQDVRPVELSTSRKFLIFGVLAFGQFMALIDIQIVAASLNDIQAGLSAGPDEISWVQTAYLMAELVMIPFSAFLAGSLSTRWLFSLSAGLFTVSSIACGFAWNIESMIVFRAVQGFVGGAMVPTAFSVGFTLFEGKQRAMIPAILGIVSVLAPTLGPTVGGIITQAIDWRWIFFINVLPGIVITTLAVSLIRVDRPNLSLLGKIDWVHLAAMAVALACLQYVLEEGPRKDWFGDPHIQIAAWCSLVGFVLFFERSFASHNPIVRLTPFARPTFAFSCVFNLVVGFGLYASTYLVPVYLGRVRGYDSLQIGTTVFIVGLGQIVGTIISARLSQTVDRRILLAIGLTGFSFSLWLASHLNAQWGFWELALPQVVRGLSIMFCIVPTVGMALGSFQGPELRNASGLFSLMRNLGGAIGIATVNTWLGDAARIQAARFGEAMASGGRVAEETLAALAARMSSVTPDPDHALSLAQAVFGRFVGREALVVGFGEVFRTMSWMFVIALVMVPFCDGRPEGATEAAPSPDTH